MLINKNKNIMCTLKMKTPSLSSFLILLTFFLVSNDNLAQKRVHITALDLDTQSQSAQKLDFGTSVPDLDVIGLHIADDPIPVGLKSLHLSLVADATSNATQSGSGLGRLGLAKSFNGDGEFVGVLGFANSTALSNSNSRYSTILGGKFGTLNTTNVNLNGNNFWVGGVYAVLEGTINNTPSNGAVAAVIGIDKNSGSAQSWAGFFDGNNYLSNQMVIGTKDIPTTAGEFDVSSFQLMVKGGVLSEEVLIVNSTEWADYVFDADYNLKSLEELEKFIEKNHHLPNIPSSATIEKTGIKLGEMTILQQEKIEEAILYIIELNKKLETQNEALKNELVDFKKRLLALEKGS